MWPIILLIVAVVVVVLIVIVAMQPAQFRIERSTTITAQPAAVFAQVNELRNWENWSPWDKIDPQLKRMYDGPPAGVGAHYRWIGNKKVGEGQMTIAESRPAEMIRIKLEFLKPLKATNTAEFTFQPQRDQTRISWAMTGKRNFVMKAFGMMMDMEKLVGGEFEKGLAQMKMVCESQGK